MMIRMVPKLMAAMAVGALPLALSACATTGETAQLEPPAPAVASTRNAQLADALARELAHLSRFDPDRLDHVQAEMDALGLALARGPVVAPSEPTPVQELPPPPPEIAQAPSLFHGIHLASYRIEDNAYAGLATLRAMFPDLVEGRQARLEAVTLDGQGEYLRLKLGPFDSRAAAQQACQAFTAAGAFCQTVDFSGYPLTDRD